MSQEIAVVVDAADVAKVKRASVDAKSFVIAYRDEAKTENPTCEGVANRLASAGFIVASMSVYQRAAKLRKEGVLLPVIPQAPRRKSKTSVEDLNALIAG